MSQSINIGLDFGSLKYRAADMIEDSLIPVPTPASDTTWVGSVMLQPTSDGRITFSSLKHELGTGQPMKFQGVKETVEDVVRDHFLGIKQSVEEYAGEKIGHTVISVPSQYSAFRRSEVIKLAESAGLGKVALVNDCAAATLDYTNELGNQSLTLLVYSMGFIGVEVSLLRVTKGRMREIAHEGATSPSGRDFDVLVMASCVDHFKRLGSPLPTKTYINHWFDFRALAAEAKHQLMISKETTITLPTYITGTEPQTIALHRSNFEEAIAPDIQSTLAWIDTILEEASLQHTDVDKVLLVGGSTRINYIQQQLEERFGPNLIQPRDDALAKGAAIQAAKLATANPDTNNSSIVAYEVQEEPDASAPQVENPPRKISPPDIAPVFDYILTLMEDEAYDKADEFLSRLAEKVDVARKDLEERRRTS